MFSLLSENFPLLCLCFGNQFAAVAMAGGQRDKRERLGLIGLFFRQNVEEANLAWNVNVQVVLQSPAVPVNCRIDNINPN